MARKVRKGRVNRKALEFIGDNYNKLRTLCNYNSGGCYCSKSYEDIFQDTILYVVHDEESFSLSEDEDFFKLFKYRYNMILFQTINDHKMLREVDYADYLQTTKEDI